MSQTNRSTITRGVTNHAQPNKHNGTLALIFVPVSITEKTIIFKNRSLMQQKQILTASVVTLKKSNMQNNSNPFKGGNNNDGGYIWVG
jgi:hypothetical protein